VCSDRCKTSVFRGGVSYIYECTISSKEVRSNLIIEQQKKLVIKWPSLLFSIRKVPGSILCFGQAIPTKISSTFHQSLQDNGNTDTAALFQIISNSLISITLPFVDIILVQLKMRH
jgi:hypothetical protein